MTRLRLLPLLWCGVGGGIWSRREGIMFAGNADRIDEELKEIEEEKAAQNEEIRKKEQKIAS